MDNDFILDSGKKFIWDVMGGTGAVWGTSEVVCLRNCNNRRLWRGISGGIGIIFFGFYLQERIKTLKNNNIR
ncbi:MAG: hypothetical protein CML42_09660 [Rhodobacteraceae bacterium]|nr:hypothetical protein [Paracoccaceae bacterium]|tara:strand:+ start:21082 stop:21297 length:216 start_codon:yes stop_codon:yes gene_type:complete